MKLQDQVCSFIQAEQLRIIGVTQSLSYFIYRHWRGNGQIIIDKRKDKYFDYAKGRHMKPYTEIICSAFTVAELGIMVPSEYYLPSNKSGDGWWISNIRQPNFKKLADTEAQARAALLISILENNFITVEEVNERLA